MNKETIVKTCKCGEKHYFTNCYNKVYDRQKKLIDKIKEETKKHYDKGDYRLATDTVNIISSLIKEYEK